MFGDLPVWAPGTGGNNSAASVQRSFPAHAAASCFRSSYCMIMNISAALRPSFHAAIITPLLRVAPFDQEKKTLLLSIFPFTPPDFLNFSD